MSKNNDAIRSLREGPDWGNLYDAVERLHGSIEELDKQLQKLDTAEVLNWADDVVDALDVLKGRDDIIYKLIDLAEKTEAAE